MVSPPADLKHPIYLATVVQSTVISAAVVESDRKKTLAIAKKRDGEGLMLKTVLEKKKDR